MAGTLVHTATGLKNIEEIEEGDRVLSRNEETGEVSYQRVSRTFVHEHQGELVTLKAGKEKVQSTPNHPVWVEGQGWKPAGELTVGEEVVLTDGKRVRVTAVEATPIRGPPVLVYNLEVEGSHTYFVGREGVWVHNKGSLGDLTPDEIQAIQNLANQAGRPIHVVGSAARGARRGVGTDLPIGKGPGTRSDIDYVIPPSSWSYWQDLFPQLPGIDPSHGPIMGIPNPHIGPYVTIEPTF